jgi:hypothetical protein
LILLPTKVAHTLLAATSHFDSQSRYRNTAVTGPSGPRTADQPA